MMEPAELRAKLQGAMVFAPTPLQARSLDLEGFRDNPDYLDLSEDRLEMNPKH